VVCVVMERDMGIPVLNVRCIHVIIAPENMPKDVTNAKKSFIVVMGVGTKGYTIQSMLNVGKWTV